MILPCLLSPCGSYDSVMLCCSCNGHNVVRVCTCQEEAMFSTCLPMKENKCVNTLLLRVDSVIDLFRCNVAFPVTVDGSTMDHMRSG